MRSSDPLDASITVGHVAVMSPGRSVLRILKDSTHGLHRRAEQYVRILDRDATVDDYARYLRAMYGFHAPIENALAADGVLESAGFAAARRRKTPWLAHDLRRLDPCDIVPPCCSALPVSDSFARRIGIAYVVEGSTLGGKYILAHLPPALAALRGTATAFLEGYGAETGARWRGFAEIAARLITAASAPGAEAEAIAGARDTFERLIAWLARFERRDQRRAGEAS
jgi:heme oxygenase